MLIKNPHRLSKQDLLDVVLEHNRRLSFRCPHGHDGFSHKNCYRASPKEEYVIGCFDLEASGLKANFAVMLSWCIKIVGRKRILYDALSIEDLEADKFDSRIVQSCVSALKGLDRVVTQYGTNFDIPFLRTRALKFDIDFPAYGTVCHTDVWHIAKRKLCLHSNRQNSIAETVLGHDIKTRIHPDIWVKVQMGSPKTRKKALEYVVDHNKKDVIQLEQNYMKLRPFIRETRLSI